MDRYEERHEEDEQQEEEEGKEDGVCSLKMWLIIIQYFFGD